MLFVGSFRRCSPMLVENLSIKKRCCSLPQVHTVHTYIHTYIHTSIHTYIHVCLHTYIHTLCYVPHTYVLFIHILAYIHTHTHTCMHTHFHLSINKHTYSILYIHSTYEWLACSLLLHHRPPGEVNDQLCAATYIHAVPAALGHSRLAQRRARSVRRLTRRLGLI